MSELHFVFLLSAIVCYRVPAVGAVCVITAVWPLAPAYRRRQRPAVWVPTPTAGTLKIPYSRNVYIRMHWIYSLYCGHHSHCHTYIKLILYLYCTYSHYIYHIQLTITDIQTRHIYTNVVAWPTFLKAPAGDRPFPAGASGQRRVDARAQLAPPAAQCCALKLQPLIAVLCA